MALFSPGVEVQVIDESFYTPAAAGTVPMIFVASAENKTNGSGTDIAEGTLKANAGKPYLLTSQRELVELFGDPLFYSDNNGNMIHAGELNEYGLQTAYSLLGVTNRVYVTRADIDLSKLTASATPPGGEPDDGTYWFDVESSDYGINEWNGASVRTSGGQSFTTKAPIVLTPSDVTKTSGESLTAPGAPKASVGQIGDYAIVSITNLNRIWYKSSGNTAFGIAAGEWVEVGSDKWKHSWPTALGDTASSAGNIPENNDIIINGETLNLVPDTVNGTTLDELVTVINDTFESTNPVVTAQNLDGNLALYTEGDKIALDGSGLADIGLTVGDYYAPSLHIAPHTDVPDFKDNTATARPTGSIWFKTTEPNGGANIRIKRYNEDTQLWETISAPMYETSAEAIYELDRAGGGENLVIGDIYTKANDGEATDPSIANFKFYTRNINGATTIASEKITGTSLGNGDFKVAFAETKVNETDFATPIIFTVSITNDLSSGVADDLAAAINAAGFTNIVAEVNSQDRVLISHKTGGDFIVYDIDGLMTDLGYAVFDPDTPTTTANYYDAPAQVASNAQGDLQTLDGAVTSVDGTFIASNWKVLDYTPAEDAPLALTADGRLWYSSVIDEVDIMTHDGNTGWRGYLEVYPDTNATGPIVSASEPEQQTNGDSLVDDDLWIDTSDIEDFPRIFRYNRTLAEWILVDKTDQSSENGVLFADARWGTAGSDIDAADIEELLTSSYLDPDAPDHVLYPRGMLLWNLRRSGFNVKRFERNYIDTSGDNIRNGDETMDGYYPHRWVTDSGNNEDGSGTFGRQAQRKSVVQKLQSMVNSNQDIRDEEARRFNLMATPGYPELIGEMITLNYDRRLTAFVVGDTPARLTPDATSLNEWAANVRLAVEDNDNGAVSFDEYMGMYYPWGFTSDNAGNNVVVPPSHMSLRTIILNDQVAYPWFAPAGTRRGGVTNATSSGYVNSEGEFVSVALNTGQRDTLYLNNINPITFISGSGLVVFGQKTRARNASALDRVNVARLIIYMRSQLEVLARPYLFEPNDKITRDQVKSAADAFLLELASLRAVYDFLVVCDESNNTPARIDRNELWLDIAIEPVKAIEFIYIPLRIKNTGEIAGLG